MSRYGITKPVTISLYACFLTEEIFGLPLLSVHAQGKKSSTINEINIYV